KNAIMSAFAAGEIDVLISTTVIEVGINIPNATLMIIENAERFGLSQLHQLRGRVGRGECQSYCILFSDNDSAASKARAEVMVSTNDGFEIAERDLSLRGFGDFFGTRQHGLPSLKIANFYEDMDILAQAKEAIRVLDLSEHQELLSEARDMFIDGL
ncbi:MAG: DNA helicase RecG, partial [Oscillospiraceae bacterium]|nr:DNA helicase RecG [Oscillospiraceae bacterium]